MTIEELRNMDVTQLKALAFDTICIIEKTQVSLRTLNQLIQEKQSTEFKSEDTVLKKVNKIEESSA